MIHPVLLVTSTKRSWELHPAGHISFMSWVATHEKKEFQPEIAMLVSILSTRHVDSEFWGTKWLSLFFFGFAGILTVNTGSMIYYSKSIKHIGAKKEMALRSIYNF